MGYKYTEQVCLNCNEPTAHQVRKYYGKSEKGKRGKGKVSLKRIVTKCLQCQKKVIVNSRKGTKRTRIISLR